MASDAYEILSRQGMAAHSGINVRNSFNEDGRYHDVRRPKDNRLIPVAIAGGLCAILAALCISVLVYTIVAGPAANSGLFGSATDNGASATDRRGAVQLPVYVPDLDSRGSRIPVWVSGTLADGSAYEKHTYVSHEGSGPKLEPGHYEFTVEESPISSGGVLYTVPDSTTVVDVAEDGTVNYVESTSLIFSSLAALSVSDDQIEAAKKFIENDPERNMYAADLAERARTRRSDAQAEIDKANAQAAAAAQAAADAAAKVEQQQQKQEQEKEKENSTDSTSESGESSSKEENGESENGTSSSSGESGSSSSSSSESSSSGGTEGGSSSGGTEGGSSSGGTEGGSSSGGTEGGSSSGGTEGGSTESGTSDPVANSGTAETTASSAKVDAPVESVDLA